MTLPEMIRLYYGTPLRTQDASMLGRIGSAKKYCVFYGWVPTTFTAPYTCIPLYIALTFASHSRACQMSVNWE